MLVYQQGMCAAVASPSSTCSSVAKVGDPLPIAVERVTICDVSKNDGEVAPMQEERFNRELGARIRAARDEARLTQEALASAVGLSRGSIANIERGDQAPPTYRLTLIAQALKLDLMALLPSADDKESQVDRLRSQLPARYAEAVMTVRSTARGKRRRRGGHG